MREYWKVFLKRRRLAITVFFVVFVAGAYCVFTATRLYTATATLKIEPQNATFTGVAEMLRLEVSGQLDYYQTQVALLQSRALAAKVISDLQLESNSAFTKARIISPNPLTRFQNVVFSFLSPIIQYAAAYFETSPPPKSRIGKPQDSSRTQTPTPNISLKPESRFTGQYRSFLKVDPIRGTRLVDVHFTTPDPELSEQLANEHAARFIRMNLETRFELTKEAREFLDKKNAELKEKLERSEDELNRFRQKHGVVSLEKGENIVIDRLVDLNRQLTVARAQRIEAESLHKVVENKSALSLSQVINQGLVPQLRSAFLTLEAEKVKLLAVLKPDHPRMIELNQQITDARRSLNAEISGVVRGIEQNYAAARAKEQALEAEAQKQQKTALDLKEVGVAYAVREEEVKVNRALYESVLKRLTETSLANHDIALSNMQISQFAERPRGSSSPNLPFYLILIAAVGTILSVGLVIVVEYFDASVSTPQHVWRAIGLSTLGVIPDVNSFRQGLFSYPRRRMATALTQKKLPAVSANASLPSKHLVSYDPRSVVGEAFRTIRTSLLFARAERPPQVILLTSPSPAEGKTLTTLNLGIALAQEGHTVLVIDADLRKGCCHTRLGISNHDGLSNVLVGQVALEQATKKTSVERLSLLSRGIIPPNPSDLLGSQMMRRLLDEVRKSYEFILIDSPPAIAVTDAPILSVFSDGVVLVLHAKKTTAGYARQLIERLDAVRATFLGVVLNGINLSNPDYSYYRHYYRSYYAAPTREVKNGKRRTSISTVDDKYPKKQDGVAESDYGTVSPQRLDYLILKFTEAAGPMAQRIIRDEAAKLGESVEAFPRKRLRDLIDSLSVVILNDNLRDEFQKTMCKDMELLSDRLTENNGLDPRADSRARNPGNSSGRIRGWNGPD